MRGGADTPLFSSDPFLGRIIQEAVGPNPGGLLERKTDGLAVEIRVRPVRKRCRRREFFRESMVLFAKAASLSANISQEMNHGIAGEGTVLGKELPDAVESIDRGADSVQHGQCSLRQ
jgi:hypothetical protein